MCIPVARLRWVNFASHEVGSVLFIKEFSSSDTHVSKRSGLAWVHMDGARFANALACRWIVLLASMNVEGLAWILCHLGPRKTATWRRSDVVFNKTLSKELGFRRKRGGHLHSKMRLLSCANEKPNLTGWSLRKNAAHANAMIGFVGRLVWRPFRAVKIIAPAKRICCFVLAKGMAEYLLAAGFCFLRRSPGKRKWCVCYVPFRTTQEAFWRLFIDCARNCEAGTDQGENLFINDFWMKSCLLEREIESVWLGEELFLLLFFERKNRNVIF